MLSALEVVRDSRFSVEDLSFKPGEASVKRVMVTPDIAKEWLSRGIDNNRNIRPSHVDGLARDMSAGQWVADSGNLIRFDDRGRLFDGQHRLSAVVKSGVSCSMWVGFNLPPDAFTVTDTNKGRSAADAIDMEGMPNGTAVAALTRMVLTWERTGGKSVRQPHSNPTNREILTRAKSDPLVHDAVRSVKSRTRIREMPPSVASFGYWLFRQIDRDATGEFMRGVLSGEGLSTGDPRLAYRRRCLNMIIRGQEEGINSRVAGLVKCWNLWRQGKTRMEFKPPTEIPKAIGS